MKNFIENTMDKAVYAAAGASLALRKQINDFWRKEDGETNLVAILLIIVVTVALVAIFKTRLTALVNNVFNTIEKEAYKI